jgi:hypothetical protein
MTFEHLTEFDEFDELCGTCGLSLGSHHAGTQPYPYNTCPGHQGKMDWENGPGHTFKPSAIFKKIPYGTLAKGGKE